LGSHQRLTLAKSTKSHAQSEQITRIFFVFIQCKTSKGSQIFSSKYCTANSDIYPIVHKYFSPLYCYLASPMDTPFYFYRAIPINTSFFYLTIAPLTRHFIFTWPAPLTCRLIFTRLASGSHCFSFPGHPYCHIDFPSLVIPIETKSEVGIDTCK
jgi:hypothetical protein